MHATKRKWRVRAGGLLALTLMAAPASGAEHIAWPYLAHGTARAGAPPSWALAGNAPSQFEYYTDIAQGLSAGKRMAIIFSGDTRPKPPGKYFATLMQSISAQEYLGKRVRLSAQIRTQDAGGAALWMRIVNKDGKALGFDNMESRQIRGTHDWEQHSIVLDVSRESAEIDFGFLLDGKGEVDAAEFTLAEVDESVQLTSTALAEKEKTVLPIQPSNLDFSQM